MAGPSSRAGDVRKHPPEILKRLSNRTMPCDGALSKEKVDLFQRWIASGMAD